MTVRPSRFRAALVGLAASAAVGLTGCAGTAPASTGGSSTASSSSAASSSADSSTGEQRIEVTFADGKASGDTGRVAVAAGSHVTLVVTSDVADQVHVHGYDIEKELSPGEPAEIAFDATVPGVFEVELHEADTVLVRLQVG